MIRFELWCDCSPQTVLTSQYLDELEEMGVTGLALMIDDSRKRWKPSWSIEQIQELNAMSENLDITVTSWPFPNQSYIEEMYVNDMNGLDRILEECPFIVGEESDTEFNWKLKYLLGFQSMNHAALSLLDMKRIAVDQKDKNNADIELTTFPGHSELTEHARVSIQCDRVIIQAYSVASRKRNGTNWKVPWNHKYAPGKMQDFAKGRAIEAGLIEHEVEIAFGLALWNQMFAGHTEREAFKKALYAGIDNCSGYTNCKLIRGWSSKWVIGKKKRVGMNELLKDIIPVLTHP